MNLTVNGTAHQLHQTELDLTQLLARLEINYPVLIELNGEAILQREFAKTRLQDGDRVELFRMVAGG